jgi:hypothetical protein
MPFSRLLYQLATNYICWEDLMIYGYIPARAQLERCLISADIQLAESLEAWNLKMKVWVKVDIQG